MPEPTISVSRSGPRIDVAGRGPSVGVNVTTGGMPRSAVAELIAAHVAYGPEPPEDTSRLWARTSAALAVVDYRAKPDGDPPAATDVGDVVLHDISTTAPPGFYAPLTLVGGALRSTVAGLGVGAAYLIGELPRTEPFRVVVGLADFTVQDGEPVGDNSSNITITDELGNGPVMHAYPTADGAGGVITRLFSGWDIDGLPVLGDPVDLDRLLGAGDRIGLGYDGATWRCYVNGTEVEALALPHRPDVVALDDIAVTSNPLGGLGGTWLAGTAWWAFTEGNVDHNPDELTVHRHDGTGWVPIGAPSQGAAAAPAQRLLAAHRAELAVLGVADEPWHEITDADGLQIVDFVNGAPVDLGTDGSVRVRWWRVGRTITATIYWAVAADANNPPGGAWALAFNPAAMGGSDVQLLPAPHLEVIAPGAGGFAVPGGFGYVNSAGAFTRYAPPAVTDFSGAGDPALAACVFLIDAPTAPTGLESILSASNPQDLAGLTVAYQGRLLYEAAEPAE
jgi:hypothetical protein